jgi:hypothetical protein
MIEEWRPVPGFEGIYAVSNLGRVKSLQRIVTDVNGRPYTVSERIMSGTITYSGYVHMSLRKTGEKQVKRLLHQLVAAAFLPAKAESLDEVNHLDGNKLNNVPANLEWCSHAANMAHAWNNNFFPNGRRNRAER